MIAYIVDHALSIPSPTPALGVKGVNQVGRGMFYLGWLLFYSVPVIAYICIHNSWRTHSPKLIREVNLTWEEEAYGLAMGEDGAGVTAVDVGLG